MAFENAVAANQAGLQNVSAAGAWTGITGASNTVLAGGASPTFTSSPSVSGLTVTSAGASITGTTSINTTGTASTTIGNSGSTTAVTISTGFNGGFTLLGGNYTFETSTLATSSASPTLNQRFAFISFQGFTTAAGATQDLTINNSFFSTSATSPQMFTVCNLNASGNNAMMRLNGVRITAGQAVLQVQNTGAAALGAGDDIRVWFWQIG